MSVESLAEATRREWRELGFYYDRDDEGRAWRIVGSAAGLLAFGRLVADYAGDRRHEPLSEHEHYGPYLSLEIGTWSQPQITGHWIAGRLADLGALAVLVAATVATLPVGGSVSLRPGFAPQAPFDLVLERRDDGFDPAGEAG